MKLKYLMFAGVLSLMLGTSCVSKKTFKAESAKLTDLQNAHTSLQTDLRNCEASKLDANKKLENLETDKKSLESRIQDLLNQIDYLKSNNNTALKQLSDLSVISSSQAESIKKSLDNIGAKDMYIKDLQSAISRKDSLNMVLVMNLKGAIGNLDDSDIEIKVEKSAVYISISDKLLFKSGSYEVTDQAMSVLAKVAKVLKAQPEIEFIVEGHTDNVPIKGGLVKDNWDLSVLRATSVVRILQNNYGLEPKRMTAGGRSEYVPLTDNTTPEGKAKNRRTRIVILPQLDQFFKLLETK
jgi:chemotaxis protein MotB